MGNPVGRPSSIISEAKLLDAAEREFSKSGFEATRLEDIAANVGVTRTTLIHRFGSKEALYVAVVARLCTRIRDALIAAMGAPGPFPQRLQATVGRFHDEITADSTAARLLLRELVDARSPGLRLIRDEVGPLLGLVEAFVHQAGKGQLRRGLDVRAAMLDVVAAMTVHAVAGPARAALYGTSGNDRRYSREHFLALASQLFLADGRKAERKNS